MVATGIKSLLLPTNLALNARGNVGGNLEKINFDILLYGS